jgi:hypothetical protein
MEPGRVAAADALIYSTRSERTFPSDIMKSWSNGRLDLVSFHLGPVRKLGRVANSFPGAHLELPVQVTPRRSVRLPGRPSLAFVRALELLVHAINGRMRRS